MWFAFKRGKSSIGAERLCDLIALWGGGATRIIVVGSSVPIDGVSLPLLLQLQSASTDQTPQFHCWYQCCWSIHCCCCCCLRTRKSLVKQADKRKSLVVIVLVAVVVVSLLLPLHSASIADADAIAADRSTDVVVTVAILLMLMLLILNYDELISSRSLCSWSIDAVDQFAVIPSNQKE